MACTTTLFKSHMELLEKMQNSPSPKLNDGLTSKAKHEVFEGVLSALAKKFYKPELLENGWHEAVANHRPIIEGAPTLEAFEQAVTALLQNLKTSHVGSFIKARGELQAVRPSAQPISRTKLPTDLGGYSKMFMMAVPRRSRDSTRRYLAEAR